MPIRPASGLDLNVVGVQLHHRGGGAPRGEPERPRSSGRNRNLFAGSTAVVTPSTSMKLLYTNVHRDGGNPYAANSPLISSNVTL
jgi:hypothetical protein